MTFHQCVFDACSDLMEGNDLDPTVCYYLEDFNKWLIRKGVESVLYHQHPDANCRKNLTMIITIIIKFNVILWQVLAGKSQIT